MKRKTLFTLLVSMMLFAFSATASEVARDYGPPDQTEIAYGVSDVEFIACNVCTDVAFHADVSTSYCITYQKPDDYLCVKDVALYADIGIPILGDNISIATNYNIPLTDFKPDAGNALTHLHIDPGWCS